MAGKEKTIVQGKCCRLWEPLKGIKHFFKINCGLKALFYQVKVSHRGLQQLEPVLEGLGQPQPVLEGLGQLQPVLEGLGQLQPVLEGPGQPQPVLEGLGQPQPERNNLPKKTWEEAAAAAGVLTMVRVDEPTYSHDNSEGKRTNKKKTPLQYRKQEPKVKEATKPLTEAEKRLFKEAFITDKARLYKRQRKYEKESDCLIIIRDNVLGKGAQTKGKYIAYGLGSIKKDFLTDGMKFDADKFYMHANHTDFQMEAVPAQNRKRKEVPDTQKSRKCCTCTCTADNSKKYKPKKVATPGTIQDDISDRSSNGDD